MARDGILYSMVKYIPRISNSNDQIKIKQILNLIMAKLNKCYENYTKNNTSESIKAIE
jgi:hypothetical protein